MLDGQVTSLCYLDHRQFIASTSKSNIYSVDVETLTPSLTSACHFSKVNDVCFPEGCSDLFATASDDDVRIWNIHNQQELLRVHVPNLHCLSLVFRKDGSSLITGRYLLYLY